MTEIWKGTLAFEMQDENHFLANRSVSCEFHWKIEDDLIKGQFMHAEYSPLVETPLEASGFRDENFLSIVVKFPFRGAYNDEGQLVLDESQKNQEMAFYGELDESGTTLTGHWESEEKSMLALGNVEVYLSTGPFSMTREN